MNLPNKLTLFRVVLIPVFVFFMVSMPAEQGALWAFGIFAIASFTDFLDGYIARKHNLVTDFGKLMDPLADKLLVMSALIGFVWLELASPIMVIAILAREFIVTSIRLVAAGKGRVIAADKWGKYKTVSQMIWICYGFLYLWSKSNGLFLSVQTLAFSIHMILAYITTMLTVISGINYIVKNKDIFTDSM